MAIRHTNAHAITKTVKHSMASFNIQPLARFAGASTSIRRPRELTYFSYDEDHVLHTQSAQSLSYYYPPLFDQPSESGQAEPSIDLSRGFDTFKKHDDSVDEHLDSLLATLMSHEQEVGERTKSDIVTWRGIMTKVKPQPLRSTTTRRIATNAQARS
jgi:RAT1-interacting protein